MSRVILSHSYVVNKKLMYYENRKMKPVIVFLKGGYRIRSSNRWVNMIKVHYMNVWKYHNEIPLHN
jgi:hypothetical protein